MNIFQHRRKRFWWMSAGALVLAGCRHAPPATDTGRSSFEFVEPAAGPPPVSSAEAATPTNLSQWREATLQEPFALPVYPPRALKAKAGRNIVGVHIIVDVTGHVREVRMSMLVFSTPGPFADDFRDAVELAVRQWRFSPARSERIDILHAGDTTYSRVGSSENVETELDVAFTFQPDGTVRQGK